MPIVGEDREDDWDWVSDTDVQVAGDVCNLDIIGQGEKGNRVRKYLDVMYLWSHEGKSTLNIIFSLQDFSPFCEIITKRSTWWASESQGDTSHFFAIFSP